MVENDFRCKVYLLEFNIIRPDKTALNRLKFPKFASGQKGRSLQIVTRNCINNRVWEIDNILN